MGSTDYLEQYFATNVVFEPLVGELFRSGFLMQVAAANNDFITPAGDLGGRGRLRAQPRQHDRPVPHAGQRREAWRA